MFKKYIMKKYTCVSRKTNYCTGDNGKNINKSISNLLYQYRVYNGISILDMTNKLVVPFNLYLKMEKDYNFSIEELVKISHILNLDLNIKIK